MAAAKAVLRVGTPGAGDVELRMERSESAGGCVVLDVFSLGGHRLGAVLELDRRELRDLIALAAAVIGPEGSP
jgi:hypothetical protein